MELSRESNTRVWAAALGLGLLISLASFVLVAAVAHADLVPGARSALRPELPECAGLAPAEGEPYASFQARAHRTECRKPWTILVYMAADNDLAPDAYWDLY